ncbi:MAG TPA: hypothetical protein VK171_04650, partial [Fimbriimonas sp.]|nr:hypothetical protein [Fimbriimonas sp.]
MADSSRADSNPEVRWFFRTFGGLKTEPTAVKFRTRKTEAFAAYLALVPGTLRSRDTLAGLFWPESPPDTARQSVRMAISNLRSLLGEDALIVEGQKVGFNSDRVSSDISEFESLIDQAGRDTANAKALRQKAFDLASEPWLPDIDADWVSAQTPRVLELAAENAVQLIELLRKDKELSQAIQIGKRALEIVGFREDLHIRLIK